MLIVDYDRDGWPDIYFTNSPTVEMALKGEKARSALYHNNHDGTFTDVTDKAGIASPCFAMGGAVGDYNNDGWPDLYVTCLGGNVLYRNNGDGTFTDVTKQAGVADGRWSTGAAFADFDGDGFVDLMVSNYVDFKLSDLPGFGKSPTCKFRGIDVQCGPRGLKGGGDSLFHNNGDGTFSEISKAAGVDDAPGYYGLGVIWSDLGNTGHPDITSPMTPRPTISTGMPGTASSTRSVLSPGPLSVVMAPNRVPWELQWPTTTTPAASPSMSPTLLMSSTRSTGTMALGTLLMCPTIPVSPLPHFRT